MIRVSEHPNFTPQYLVELPDFKPWWTSYESVCRLWDWRLLIHIVKKSTPRFTRLPSLVLIRLVLTEIQRFKNVKINKEMYGIRKLCRTGPIRMAIHFFVNFDIFKRLYLAYFWVYHDLHQTWEFCKAWSALYPWLCGSTFDNPIIYRLVSSPSRFENRQWTGLVPRSLADEPLNGRPAIFCGQLIQGQYVKHIRLIVMSWYPTPNNKR